nr:MAG TPA: Protein of unknown function (DUF2977) [Bacteriophage sp.]
MKIVTDESNVITAILYAGDMGGAIEVTDPPADLDTLKYKYINGAFIACPDYTPPESEPAPAVSSDDRLSATEDAVAEIIEMLMGGDSDG